MSASAAVGLLAATLSILFAWPQAIRAVRSDSPTGVSGRSVSLMVVTTASWAVYAAMVADGMMLFANVATDAALVLTLVVVLRRTPYPARETAAIIGVWALVLAAGATAFGAPAAGVIGSTLGTAMTVPQAVHLVRGHGAEGLSLLSYGLLAAVMGTWLVYGLLIGDPIVVAPNVIAMPVVLTVCVMVFRHQRTAPVLEVAAA